MPDILIYAGKSHLMLRGADMAFTYVLNTTKEDRLLKDMLIYFSIILKGSINAYGAIPENFQLIGTDECLVNALL